MPVKVDPLLKEKTEFEKHFRNINLMKIHQNWAGNNLIFI